MNDICGRKTSDLPYQTKTRQMKDSSEKTFVGQFFVTTPKFCKFYQTNFSPKRYESVIHVFTTFVQKPRKRQHKLQDVLDQRGNSRRCYKDIYPPELELGKENLDSSRAYFLDLDIKVEDRIFVYNQYDKRDAFPFLLYAFHLCAVICQVKYFTLPSQLKY